MAMPRPKGRVYKIAEKVVPGLSKSDKSSSVKRENPLNDPYEDEMILINESRGHVKTKQDGGPSLRRWDFRNAGY